MSVLSKVKGNVGLVIKKNIRRVRYAFDVKGFNEIVVAFSGLHRWRTRGVALKRRLCDRAKTVLSCSVDFCEPKSKRWLVELFLDDLKHCRFSATIRFLASKSCPLDLPYTSYQCEPVELEMNFIRRKRTELGRTHSDVCWAHCARLIWVESAVGKRVILSKFLHDRWPRIRETLLLIEVFCCSATQSSQQV